MPVPVLRPRSSLLALLLLWVALYGSFTLFRPALLDDADSVHVEVAREMLLRRDPVTLYANGIRYLEKAPLHYWMMAASMGVAQVLGARRPETLAAAARVPLALAVLGLALLVESLARWVFRSARAGLYAGLILLSSFGVFIFTRITIPDALVCVWITASMWAFWRTEVLDGSVQRPAELWQLRRGCWIFAATCALNVLTKGLIGVVFPVAIVLVYLLLTRGWRRGVERMRQLLPVSSILVFLLIAAPWHVLAGLANPTEGHPAPFVFVRSTGAVLPWGHWQVPLPTDGNVRGWWWFYFMNEHLLRYLNLRVPRDYDTVPLVLFWGLCLVWMMPWSGFVFKAVSWAVPVRTTKWRSQWRRHDLPLPQRGRLLLVVWAGFVLLFFSLSTRQEYYVLPALPGLAVLLGGWLAYRGADRVVAAGHRLGAQRVLTAMAGLGLAAGCACVGLLLHTRAGGAGTDLATLLNQNPGEYALSFGHFLDLNAQAMGMFRVPLALCAVSLGLGWPVARLLRGGVGRTGPRVRLSNYVLAGSTFGFLLAAWMGLRTFAPVLSSAQLAEAVRGQVQPGDLVVLHGEYEAGSTLGFYLGRPLRYEGGRAVEPLHILEGRSSNLWYGSFFPDAPPIFETEATLAAAWRGPGRVFLWQSLTDPPNQVPALPGAVYVLARGGGKEIVSNRR